MTEIEMQNLINEKLKAYLLPKTKNLDIGQIIELINSQIIEMFDCDKQKLVYALELFNRNLETGQNLKFADYLNKILISNSSEIYVKGFLSKDNPMLFFYSKNDENPFAKITTDFLGGNNKFSVEISNNSNAVADFKKGKAVSNAYLVNIDYTYTDGKIEESKNIFAETKLVENSKYLNVPDELNSSLEYFNFLNLIKNANQNSKIDLSKISGFSLGILFNNFYDEMKNLCFDEYNLSLENIIYLINSTVYDDSSVNPLKVPNSKFVQLIESIDKTNETSQNRKLKIKIDKNSNAVEYDVIKSEKYLSIDVNENGKKQCGLMVISTADGFSAFVSNGNTKTQNKPAFVINFSAGQIKVMSVDNKPAKTTDNNFEITVSLDEEFLKFNSTSSIFKSLKDINKKNINGSNLNLYSAVMQ